MKEKYLNLNIANIDHEHICCGKDEKRQQHGTEIKKEWLKKQINKGHVFRKLNEDARIFIEYGPLEDEFVPIIGDNYMYIYCFWVEGAKKKECGQELLEYAINDAKEKGKNGICLVANKQKMAFLPDSKNLTKFGFNKVDEAKPNYELWALKFNNALDPKFTPMASENEIDEDGLVIYYNDECPLIYNSLIEIEEYCLANNIKLNIHHVTLAQEAKNIPCFMNNFMAFYNGKFLTHEILNKRKLKNYIDKKCNWAYLLGGIILGSGILFKNLLIPRHK